MIFFTIYGNQEDPNSGNPIPYHRTTQGSYWNKGAKRYKAWKDYVVKEFCKSQKIKDTGNKPITIKEKVYVDIVIYYKDRTHADSDNVAKGINDALFVNDKNVAGSYDFFYDKQCPRVEVTIKGAVEHA